MNDISGQKWNKKSLEACKKKNTRHTNKDTRNGKNFLPQVDPQ